MPTYGKVKVNTLTYDDSGSAVDLAISNIAVKASPTFTGTITGASLVLSGDLTVNGTTTTIDTTTLQVEDKNIEIGKVSTPSNTTADGGGITLLGGSDGNKTINWVNSTDAWTFSENINIAAGKKLGIGGSNYGTSGHVLTSGGSGSAPTWSALPAAGSTVSLVADGAIGNNVACNVKSNGKVEAVTEIVAGANESIPSTGAGADNQVWTYDREHNLFVLWFRQSNDLKCMVGTPTGTGSTSTISWGSVQVVLDVEGTYNYLAAEYIWYNDTNKHVIAFLTGTPSLYVVAVDVAANGTITVGSASHVTNNVIEKKPSVANGHEASYPFILFYVKSTSDELKSRDGIINTSTNAATCAGETSALGGSSDNFTDPVYGFKLHTDRTMVIAQINSGQWKYNSRIAGSWKDTTNFEGTAVSRLTMFYDSASAKIFAFYIESGNFKWKYASLTSSSSNGGIGTWSSANQNTTEGNPLAQNTYGGKDDMVVYDTLNSKYWYFYSQDSPAQKSFLYGFTVASNGTITWDSSSKEIVAAEVGPQGLFYETSLDNPVAYNNTKMWTSYGSSSTATTENFLGWSSAAYSDGDTSEIKVIGNTVTGLSSLTPGQTYYLQKNGSLALTPVLGMSITAGLALTSTSLLIKG